jgi:hypothetical protein
MFVMSQSPRLFRSSQSDLIRSDQIRSDQIRSCGYRISSPRGAPDLVSSKLCLAIVVIVYDWFAEFIYAAWYVKFAICKRLYVRLCM